MPVSHCLERSSGSQRATQLQRTAIAKLNRKRTRILLTINDSTKQQKTHDFEVDEDTCGSILPWPTNERCNDWIAKNVFAECIRITHMEWLISGHHQSPHSMNLHILLSKSWVYGVGVTVSALIIMIARIHWFQSDSNWIHLFGCGYRASTPRQMSGGFIIHEMWCEHVLFVLQVDTRQLDTRDMHNAHDTYCHTICLFILLHFLLV